MEATKLLRIHEQKLRLIERKRRLLFPGDALPDPPPHDDFIPVSSEPLIKHVLLDLVPEAHVTTIKLLPTPIVSPARASRNIEMKMAGAMFLAAVKGGYLIMYDAFGNLVKSIDCGFGATEISAIGTASTGTKALIALGGANGTVALYRVVLFGGNITNFTVNTVPLNLTKATEAEMRVQNISKSPISQAAITAIQIISTRKNVVVYAGDAQGWLRAYSGDGILLRQVQATNGAASPAVSTIACCAGSMLVMAAGKYISLVTTNNLKVWHCHLDEDRIASLTIDSKAQFMAFVGTTTGNIKTLRISRSLSKTSNPAANATFCQVMNSRNANTTDPIQVEALQGYLVVRKTKHVSVYNATRAAHFAPWHVFDVPSNASDISKALLTTDGAFSFVISDTHSGEVALYHSSLPQLTSPAGFELPGRPYIIGAAILIAFGYQFYNRKVSKGKNEAGDDEFYQPERKKTGYGKYGTPSKFGGGNLDNISRDMSSIGSRTEAIEERMQALGSMTNELQSNMKSFVG